MDVKQRTLCLLLLFGTILVHGQRRETNSVAYSPSYSQPRPTTDTDGAIYQKTVNGVSFKIVSMCQEFDTVFKPGIMEFKTLQGGCRFVVTFDRSLPTSQTIYTPSARPVYNQPPPRRYYQSQAAERAEPYYPPPKAPAQPPPQEIRYSEPAVRPVVRERTYAAPPPPSSAQQYSPPEPTIRYVPAQQSAPAPPPRNQQQSYIPRLAASPNRVAAPPPRIAAPPPRVAAPPPRVAVPPPRVAAPPPRVAALPPRVAAPPPRGPPTQRAGPPPPHGTPYSSAGARPQPVNDPRRLDHFQMEALGLRQLHERPPQPTPPPSDAPIPRV